MKTIEFWTALRRVLLMAAVALAVREWVWMPLRVCGDSMRPTLSDGNIVGLNRLAYRFSLPRRGDVVAVRTERELMVKRILGLPGEEIRTQGGVFYINGCPLGEPYVKLKESEDIAPGQLGANRFAIAGDNRQRTLIAVVSGDRIVGRVRTWN